MHRCFTLWGDDGRNKIADYINLTIKTASRSTGKPKSRNIITLVESGKVVILGHERLRQADKATAWCHARRGLPNRPVLMV